MNESPGLRRLLRVVGCTAIVLSLACLIWEWLGFVQFCQSPPQDIETALMVLVAVTVVSGLMLGRLTRQAREAAQERRREPVSR